MSNDRYFSITPVARQISFDPTGTPLVSTDVQNAILESLASASPGFSFARAGNTPPSTWLSNEGVPSSQSGRVVALVDAIIKQVFIANEDESIFTVTIYYHNGNLVGLTSLGSLTTAAQRTNAFNVNYPVPTNTQLAIRITSGSAKNVVVGCQLQGSIV